MMVISEEFNKFIKEFETFKTDISCEINTIPQKVLDSKIEVKNGRTQTISIGEAIKQNWEKTAKIAEGDINIKVSDAHGYSSNWKLTELLDKIDKKPTNALNRLSTFSDKFTKIIKFAEAIGIFYLVYYLLAK